MRAPIAYSAAGTGGDGASASNSARSHPHKQRVSAGEAHGGLGSVHGRAWFGSDVGSVRSRVASEQGCLHINPPPPLSPIQDSLWIWGLFKEPLYPFILFSLPCVEIPLADGTAIPAGTLYVQAEHRRDPAQGVRLGAGAVTYRLSQQLDADLLGLSGFTYDEPILCGTSKFFLD